MDTSITLVADTAKTLARSAPAAYSKASERWALRTLSNIPNPTRCAFLDGEVTPSLREALCGLGLGGLKVLSAVRNGVISSSELTHFNYITELVGMIRGERADLQGETVIDGDVEGSFRVGGRVGYPADPIALVTSFIEPKRGVLVGSRLSEALWVVHVVDGQLVFNDAMEPRGPLSERIDSIRGPRHAECLTKRSIGEESDRGGDPTTPPDWTDIGDDARRIVDYGTLRPPLGEDDLVIQVMETYATVGWGGGERFERYGPELSFWRYTFISYVLEPCREWHTVSLSLGLEDGVTRAWLKDHLNGTGWQPSRSRSFFRLVLTASACLEPSPDVEALLEEAFTRQASRSGLKLDVKPTSSNVHIGGVSAGCGESFVMAKGLRESRFTKFEGAGEVSYYIPGVSCFIVAASRSSRFSGSADTLACLRGGRLLQLPVLPMLVSTLRSLGGEQGRRGLRHLASEVRGSLGRALAPLGEGLWRSVSSTGEPLRLAGMLTKSVSLGVAEYDAIRTLLLFGGRPVDDSMFEEFGCLTRALMSTNTYLVSGPRFEFIQDNRVSLSAAPFFGEPGGEVWVGIDWDDGPGNTFIRSPGDLFYVAAPVSMRCSRALRLHSTGQHRSVVHVTDKLELLPWRFPMWAQSAKNCSAEIRLIEAPDVWAGSVALVTGGQRAPVPRGSLRDLAPG